MIPQVTCFRGKFLRLSGIRPCCPGARDKAGDGGQQQKPLYWE